MWRDLINKRAIRSALWCALYLIVTILAQNTIFARVRLWGVHAMFVPAVVIAVAMFHGSVWGAVFGLAAGFLCDMGYPETNILFLTLLPFIGFGAGMASEYLVNRTLLGFLCLCMLGFLITGFAQMFRPWIFKGAAFAPLLGAALRQTIVSLPLAIPYFYISRGAARKRVRTANTKEPEHG